jgi:hypothetical protein
MTATEEDGLGLFETVNCVQEFDLPNLGLNTQEAKSKSIKTVYP